MIKVLERLDEYRWHRWFAWHPVYLPVPRTGTHYKCKRVWWEYVERQRWDNWGCSGWEYRMNDEETK